MSTTVWKVVRAVAGAIVLMALIGVVNRWWGEYRELSGSVQTPGTEATATPAPTESENGGEAPETSEPPSEASKTVIVLTDGLNFREEPSSKANVIRGLDEGEKLSLIEEKSGWYYVEDEDGTKGWISAKSSYSKVE